MFGAKAMTVSVHETLRTDKESVISLAPITTRGIEGRCWIEIPVRDIPQVIAALKSIAEEVAHGEGNSPQNHE